MVMQDKKFFRKIIAVLATILMVLAASVGSNSSAAWAQDETDATESAVEAPQSDSAEQGQEAVDEPTAEPEQAAPEQDASVAPESSNTSTSPESEESTTEESSEETTPAEEELEISDEPAMQAQRATVPAPSPGEEILGTELYPDGPFYIKNDTELWYETAFDSPAEVTKVVLSGEFSFTQEQINRYQQWFGMQISRRDQNDVTWDFEHANEGVITINFPAGAVYDESNAQPDSRDQHFANLRVPDALFRGISADITVYGTLIAPEDPNNPSSDDFVRGDWRNKMVADNPALPERCGLNVALVFDLSNSVGERGLQGTKNAGKAFINSLYGTPTNIGIYNFGTYAPVNHIPNLPNLDLTNRDDVNTALNNIDSFEYGSHYVNDMYDDNGGTNWEGALKNVRNSGVKYDVVYFVTDGVPTTNNAISPTNYNNYNYDGWYGDPGRITHNQDISKAIDQANLLKDSGTRVEVLAVGDFTSGVPVLKDSVGYNGGVYWYDYGDGTFDPQFSAVNPQKKTFWVTPAGADGDPDFTPLYDSQIGRFGYYRPLLNNYPYHFYLEDEITSSTTGQRNSKTIYYNNDDGTGRWSTTVTWDVYRSNYTSGQEIMKSISGSAENDVRFVDNYDHLAAQLKEAATQYCQGSLIVQKQIVNENGEIIDEKAEGWTFTDSALEGDLRLIRRDGSDENSQTTDETGQVGYRFKTDVPHKNGKVTIDEIAQEGYALHQQDGQNAKCNVTDVAGGGGESKPISVENSGNTGFSVGIGTGTAVYCIVQNKKSDVVVNFSVQKVDAENNGEPLDGAQFTVYPATVTDFANSTEGIALIPVEGDGSKLVLPPDAKLKPGSYQLVETKAPTGPDGRQYSLLPQPITFNLAAGPDGKSEVTLPDTSFAVVDDNDLSVIKVANVYAGELPKTGGAGVGILALIGLLIVSAGVYVARRGNKDKD